MTDSLIPFHKMTVDFIEEQDGGLSMIFDWDETDPDLAYWSSISEHEQRSFIKTALLSNLKDQLDDTSWE